MKLNFILTILLEFVEISIIITLLYTQFSEQSMCSVYIIMVIMRKCVVKKKCIRKPHFVNSGYELFFNREQLRNFGGSRFNIHLVLDYQPRVGPLFEVQGAQHTVIGLHYQRPHHPHMYICLWNDFKLVYYVKLCKKLTKQ